MFYRIDIKTLDIEDDNIKNIIFKNKKYIKKSVKKIYKIYGKKNFPKKMSIEICTEKYTWGEFNFSLCLPHEDKIRINYNIFINPITNLKDNLYSILCHELTHYVFYKIILKKFNVYEIYSHNCKKCKIENFCQYKKTTKDNIADCEYHRIGVNFINEAFASYNEEIYSKKIKTDINTMFEILINSILLQKEEDFLYYINSFFTILPYELNNFTNLNKIDKIQNNVYTEETKKYFYKLKEKTNNIIKNITQLSFNDIEEIKFYLFNFNQNIKKIFMEYKKEE